MPLPPGVSARDFGNALRRLEQAVGKEWVFSSEEDVNLYRDSYSPFWQENEEPIPSAAVAPESVEQVQEIVQIANTYKLPLWTVSTGKNLGYGGSAPLLSGSVVLDLKRMNRILEVDDKNHYALVEPGVSYFDLYRYTQEKGLNVFIDAPDPGWGSPVGNTLERGGGHRAAARSFCVAVWHGSGAGQRRRGPHGNGRHSEFQNVAAVQVRLRSLRGWNLYAIQLRDRHENGSLALPDAGSPHHRNRVGAQTPRPDSDGRGFVVPHEFDHRSGNHYDRESLQGAARDPELAALRSKPGGASIPELEAYLERKNLPYWSVELPFYGPVEVVAAQWQFAKRKYSSIPGVKFQDGTSHRFPVDPKELEKVVNTVPLGIPSLAIFSSGGPRSQGHIFFSPITPMTGEAVIEAMDVFDKTLQEMGVTNVGVVPAGTYYPRSFFFLFIFPIEHDVEKNRKMRAAFKRVVQVAAEHGWGEYRTHTAFMDDVANAYSFNNHALRRLHETIKTHSIPKASWRPARAGFGLRACGRIGREDNWLLTGWLDPAACRIRR